MPKNYILIGLLALSCLFIPPLWVGASEVLVSPVDSTRNTPAVLSLAPTGVIPQIDIKDVLSDIERQASVIEQEAKKIKANPLVREQSTSSL